MQYELRSVSAETNYINLVAGEEDIKDVMKTLYKQGWTVKSLYSIRKWDGIEERCNIPSVRNLIQDKIDSFHQMDIPLAFKLLGKAGQLLRVAYAGCNGFRCSENVIDMLSKYQTLVSEAMTYSSHFVYVCMRALKYHRFAHYYIAKKQLKKSLKQFKRTILLAEKMQTDSKQIVNETEVIRMLCSTAYHKALNQKNLAHDEKAEMVKKIEEYEEKRTEYEINAKQLKEESDELNVLVQKIKREEAKVISMKEVERRRNVLALKCRYVNRDVWHRVCNTVRSWWWSRTTCRHVHGTVTEYKCQRKVSALLERVRNDRLRELSKRLNKFRALRLQYEGRKLVKRKQERSFFMALQHTTSRLKGLKDMEKSRGNVLDFAIVSLDVASGSMFIVRTSLQKMVDFWENIIQHTDELIRNGNEKLTNTEEYFLEKIFESGFSWLSLGKVLRIAAIEMQKTSATVNEAFTTLPTIDQAKQIIDKDGPELIKETLALSKQYEVKVRENEKRIKKIRQQQKSDTEISNAVVDIDDEDFNFDEDMSDFEDRK